MKSLTTWLLFGLAASANAAGCNRDNCFRGLLGKKLTKECLSYASAAKTDPPTYTYTRDVMQVKQVIITPSAVVLHKTTIGEAKIITTTIYTTLPPAMEAAGTTSTPKLVKRAEIPIPKYVSSVCSGEVGRRFLSACSCIIAELNTAKANVVLPAVTPRSTTITNCVTKLHTTTLPIPTSTVIVTAAAATSVKTVVEVVKSTPSARPQSTTFKIKLKGGLHDGRYLFPGPVFDEQPGIYYSMFTPNRDDSIDFKMNKDGVISSISGGLNLTYSTDFDDDSRYPPEKEGDPMIRVPSFVFLMAAETQAIPDYNSYPIKCALTGTDLACGAGAKRIESGWYAFGIDATNYIPTLGLCKPNHDWIYWPGQKVGLSIEWN
ncbi:hypothetical protein AOL_s00079g423 [Orbilia oligospora ATCC 24927]|uniref:Ubiquitin 3 binding protein But2 C-terminal domain-containing protein n=2 Tax=Orbilia oligospora TaxID=2813651 RepID=G1XDN8_ARTOA|nr:hypothetical protein AOL_s00079g423 [Orbilia oligospora ATCC 24927]EGX48784.1 hypothetical protein AOL_s00079g423 [Orbilia oligospora ATCC 24927]KAF3287356.1 hypothetical protein TWF970_007082 [Orbilia oligospora]